MKLLKLALISVFVLFVIITLMGLLLPSTVRVTRNITIQAPQDSVLSYIADLAKWHTWLEGMQEGNMTIIPPAPGKEASVALIGGQVVSIQKSTENTVESVWKNKRGNRQLGVFQLFADTATHSTNLNWYFEQHVQWYPWERLSTLANDKIMGPFMEHSLDNLKALAEAQP